uniref:Uncharacterized protein n=1 Tax=Terrapene triunguis TaxID=2587831 RepID=A0A674IUH0_9SAUR
LFPSYPPNSDCSVPRLSHLFATMALFLVPSSSHNLSFSDLTTEFIFFKLFKINFTLASPTH